MIVSFKELVLLKVIQEYTEKHGQPPTYTELVVLKTKGGLYNQFLIRNRIRMFYASKLNSNGGLQKMIDVLRGAGLMEQTTLQLTPEGVGMELPRFWRDWSYRINIDNGIPKDSVRLPRV